MLQSLRKPKDTQLLSHEHVILGVPTYAARGRVSECHSQAIRNTATLFHTNGSNSLFTFKVTHFL